MKTTILLGLLLTLTVSCKHHSNPVTTEEKLIYKSSNRYNRHHMHIGNFNHFALLW